jgi:hypothetical protein
MKLDPQYLRLNLLALHRRVLFLGPWWNFLVLLALLFAAAGAALYFFPTNAWVIPFVFIVPSFALHKVYFIDLPATKNLLIFFEQHHPELCSWLEESALLEATMLSEQKGL